MNNDKIKNLVNNFNISQWNIDEKKEIFTFKEDFDLKIKLENKHKRSEDEIMNDSSYDPVFAKYRVRYIVDVVFYYDDNKLDMGNTFLETKKIIIPNPVGANMVDNFYKNEYEIARAFSKNKKEFDDIMKDSIIYADYEGQNIK